MAKAFTTDQIIQLRNNPYTYRVTAKHIRFTKEFKELFYQKRQEGMSLRDTFASLGYDPDVLGKDRIEGISYLINKAMREEGRFREGTRPRNSILDEDDPEVTKENFRRMQHELQLLRQEMDFIKKILASKEAHHERYFLCV